MTHLQLLARGQQTQPWGRACLPRSRWRRCWKNRPLLQWSCHWASDRRAGFHVPDSTVPSRHCPSGLRPGRHGHWYIPSSKIKHSPRFSFLSTCTWALSRIFSRHNTIITKHIHVYMCGPFTKIWKKYYWSVEKDIYLNWNGIYKIGRNYNSPQ